MSPGEQSSGLFLIYKTPLTLWERACSRRRRSSRFDAECATAFASKPAPTRRVVCFLEIVENNIHDLSKRDIKPLQITVLSRF
jgi:hypothetical protein